MLAKLVVGISGNLTRPSKTRLFVNHIARHVADGIGAPYEPFDSQALRTSFGEARLPYGLPEPARAIVERLAAATVVVAGSPTFKGSYTGLFKHLFDLLDPAALRGKPVIVAATGGGDRHSLIVEHQLRPLFGFFEALTIPTAIYASDKDFADGVLVSEAIRLRARQAVGEACSLVGGPRPISLAA